MQDKGLKTDSGCYCREQGQGKSPDGETCVKIVHGVWKPRSPREYVQFEQRRGPRSEPRNSPTFQSEEVERFRKYWGGVMSRVGAAWDSHVKKPSKGGVSRRRMKPPAPTSVNIHPKRSDGSPSVSAMTTSWVTVTRAFSEEGRKGDWRGLKSKWRKARLWMWEKPGYVAAMKRHRTG